jgi:hypothetical protein
MSAVLLNESRTACAFSWSALLGPDKTTAEASAALSLRALTREAEARRGVARNADARNERLVAVERLEAMRNPVEE